MSNVVIGTLAFPGGLNHKTDQWGQPSGGHVMEPGGFRDRQPQRIAACFEHDLDWQVGHVVHLERSAAEGITCVLQISDAAAQHMTEHGGPGAWHYSPGVIAKDIGRTIHGRGYAGAFVEEVTLTRSPAGSRARPLRCIPNLDLYLDDGQTCSNLRGPWLDTLRRAHQAIGAARYRNDPGFTLIHDLDPAPAAKPAPVKVRAAGHLDGAALSEAQLDTSLALVGCVRDDHGTPYYVGHAQAVEQLAADRR